jgi:hypothetical protein
MALNTVNPCDKIHGFVAGLARNKFIAALICVNAGELESFATP